jgi:hypothetical protein
MDLLTQRQLAVTRMASARMGCMTWPGTSGNGSTTGILGPSIKVRPLRIRWGRVADNLACCGAARGSAVGTSSALRIGSGSLRLTHISTSVSVACSRPDSGILFPEILVF